MKHYKPAEFLPPYFKTGDIFTHSCYKDNTAPFNTEKDLKFDEDGELYGFGSNGFHTYDIGYKAIETRIAEYLLGPNELSFDGEFHRVKFAACNRCDAFFIVDLKYKPIAEKLQHLIESLYHDSYLVGGYQTGKHEFFGVAREYVIQAYERKFKRKVWC